MDLLPNSAIEMSREADQAADVKHIAIIGGGPSGLGALKVVLESPQYKAGLWRPVVFEAREAAGGIWVPAPPVDNPPLTPLYDSLTTNVPHPTMGFPDLPFPPSTLLFPTAATVLEYLNSYAEHFGLNKHIRLHTTVQLIEWDKVETKWHVHTSPTGQANPVEDGLYDLVVVANGHYREPYYPDVPGIRIWLDAGKAIHSAWYRHAEKHGDTVLVVGGGPSGIDVADEMHAVSKTVIHSIPNVEPSDDDGGARKRRGLIQEYQDVREGRVLFEDGTTETGIDYCILATGYEHSLPFLPPSVLELSPPPPPPPLPSKLHNSKFHIYPLAKQIFPLVKDFPPSRLGFLVLSYRVLPYALAEAQTRAILKVFADPDSLDLTQEAVDIVSKYEELRAEVGDDEHAIARAWHKLEGQTLFDYQDALYDFIGGDFAGPRYKTPTWLRDVWDKKDKIRKEWKAIVAAGEGEKWVAGIGEAGGEAGMQEWVDVLYKIIRRAEERQAGQEAGAEARL